MATTEMDKTHTSITFVPSGSNSRGILWLYYNGVNFLVTVLNITLFLLLSLIFYELTKGDIHGSFVGMGFVISFMLLTGGIQGCIPYYYDLKAYQQTTEYKQEQELKKVRARTKQERRARRRHIEKEAHVIKKKVVDALANMGFSKKTGQNAFYEFKKKVRIDAIVCTDDAVYLKVNGLSMPNARRPDELPETVTSLSMILDREVNFEQEIGIGIWFMIGLRSGVGGVPRYFPYYDPKTPTNAQELLPKTNAYTIPIGVGRNASFSYVDVRDALHMIVAGATGGGKSNFVNTAICELIRKNTPEEIQFSLIDLKGGLEFSMYEGLPHLWGDIVIEREKVKGCLQSVFEEKERRMKIMRGAGVKNITAFNNYRKKDRLPWLVVVFDEIQNLMLFSDTKKDVEKLLADLSQQGRAVGIVIWLATQYPTAKVITNLIKANCQTIVCFGTNESGSMVVLGNWGAKGLPKNGRCIFRYAGKDDREIQTAHIKEKQLKETIKEAKKKATPTGETFLDDREIKIIKHALQEHGGIFQNRTLTKSLRLSANVVANLGKKATYDPEKLEPIIVIDHKRYLLLFTGRRQDGRVLYGLGDGEALPNNKEDVEKLHQMVKDAVYISSLEN